MLRRAASSLTYANVVSTICLFILLGGSAYAAVQVSGSDIRNDTIQSRDVKNDSIRTQDIKENTIKESNVRDGSLLARDFAPGQLPDGATGPAGPPGPAGNDGADGHDGADAPDGADVYNLHQNDGTPAELVLPAGTYLISAKATVVADSGAPTQGQCLLNDNDDGLPFDDSLFYLDAVDQFETVPVQMTATFDAPTTMQLRCTAFGPGPVLRMNYVDISALKIARVNP
jgi:hypothetical protein